jgi:hypothetical protein
MTGFTLQGQRCVSDGGTPLISLLPPQLSASELAQMDATYRTQIFKERKSITRFDTLA